MESLEMIALRPTAMRRLLTKLSPNRRVLELCYEARPCRYGLYRMRTKRAIAAVWSRWACSHGSRVSA